METDRTIFLTGATGLLGREILKSILESEPNSRVLVLIRGDPTRFENLVEDTLRAELMRRVEPVWGDLEKPDLGLDGRMRSAITERITHVIHPAASVDFAMPYDAAHAVNYDGTVRVYELACQARHLRAFAHVSTAYVAGRRTGLIAEDELNHDAGFVNDYEHTKYESEQFLRARMGELPIAVYRTATMIGNSRTGQVRQFNYFHHSMRFLYYGLLPAIPGQPNSPADAIPEDWAGEAVRILALENFHPGTTYHLCSEPLSSFSVQELIDVTCQLFATSPYSKRHSIQPPRILAPMEFQIMLECARQEGRAARILQLLKPFDYFIAHLGLPKVFDMANLHRDLDAQQHGVPAIDSYYSQVIDYCLKTQWGKPAGWQRPFRSRQDLHDSPASLPAHVNSRELVL